MRGNAALIAGPETGSPAPAPSSSAPITSGRARGHRRPGRPGPRRPARRRHRGVRPAAPRGGPPRAARREPRRSTEPRQRRTSGYPTKTTPNASRPSSPSDEPTVLYFGKLLHNKGVHVLFEALRASSPGGHRRLRRLPRGARAPAPPRTLFTGPLEHRHLAQLIPLTDVTVVPSIFPEAFGMVAAEAAAAGSPAARRESLGPRRDAAGHRRRVSGAHRDLDEFHHGDPADLEGKLRRLLALDPGRAAELPKPGGRSSNAGAGQASRAVCSSLRVASRRGRGGAS